MQVSLIHLLQDATSCLNRRPGGKFRHTAQPRTDRMNGTRSRASQIDHNSAFARLYDAVIVGSGVSGSIIAKESSRNASPPRSLDTHKLQPGRPNAAGAKPRFQSPVRQRQTLGDAEPFSRHGWRQGVPTRRRAGTAGTFGSRGRMVRHTWSLAPSSSWSDWQCSCRGHGSTWCPTTACWGPRHLGGRRSCRVKPCCRGSKPLHLSGGSRQGGTRKYRERLATSVCSRARARRIPYAVQRGALGHDPVLHIPPERDSRFSCERHNADTLTPGARRAKAHQEPLRQSKPSAEEAFFEEIFDEPFAWRYCSDR